MQVGLNTADYQVPAVDPDGNPLTYRLATLAECRGVNPSGLSISSTGLLSFNTVGKTIGHLYSAILVVEDGNTKTMLDFIIKIVGNGQPPVFVAPTPAFGSTLNATVGQQLCFTISATDPDNNFTLTASGLPVGTSANPTLPLGPGSALSTQICLTPGPNDLGTNLVIFSATDADGLQVNHVLTIEIVCPNPDPDSDGDGFTACGGDCDDNNDAIYPGATEICDGLDNDCDFAIDEGLPTTTYYSDDDGDGFGDDHHPQNFCSPPPGFVANDDDCDDECAACNPTATEICDGLDNDCDGLIDEGGVCCTAPTFTACPTAPITTNTDAGVCTAVVNYTATADGSPTPTYTYAFSGATSGSGSGTGSGAAFEKGTTTVTVTATNNCGAPVCSFTVTVLDSHNPSIVCPNNISRNTDLNQCSAIVTYASPTFSDNCTGAFLTR
ncbi:MAG: putative metal-binding motif-containing protein, partial [Saprospiraceae bacterium]